MGRWGTQFDKTSYENTEKEKAKILASIPFNLDISRLPLDNIQKTEEYLSRLRSIDNNHLPSNEDKKYFIERGVNEEFIQKNEQIYFDGESWDGYLNTDIVTIDRLEKSIINLIIHQLDYSDEHNRQIFKTALSIYDNNSNLSAHFKSNPFKDEVTKILASPEQSAKKDNLIRTFAQYQDETNAKELYRQNFYLNYNHLFPDGLKIKAAEHLWLNEINLPQEQHQFLSKQYKELTGKDIDSLRDESGKSRFEKLLQRIEDVYSNSCSEIAEFYLSDIKHICENLPSKDSDQYLKALNYFGVIYSYALKGDNQNLIEACSDILITCMLNTVAIISKKPTWIRKINKKSLPACINKRNLTSKVKKLFAI